MFRRQNSYEVHEAFGLWTCGDAPKTGAFGFLARKLDLKVGQVPAQANLWNG
jgi:hypothetical protein